MSGSPSSEPNWDRLAELFDELRQLGRSEREDGLETLRQTEPDLAERLAALLAADAAPGRADAILDSMAAPRPATPADLPVGTRVGGFTLRERIGSGGMGTVYLAVRDTPDFEQRVAVKVIGARHRDSVHARFDAERRILARLDHPAIARLIDGGVSDGVGAYLAMEYVDGSDVVRHCADKALGLDARLALIRQACDAVAYAHRQLIVHRDLKPSNVMVTADGRVKLLDFGIAKLLDESDLGSDQNEAGPATTPWMTPEYASPEQIEGSPTTTATDVYQLGVLLYELLTGQLPHGARASTSSPLAVAQAVLTTDPTPPSRVRPSGTLTVPAIVSDADLDAIVMKSLHRDPARRYPSAEAFARDLERYTTGQPVEARPDSWGYRARKFASRNRYTVGAAVVAVASMFAGTAAALVQRAEARAQRDEAIAASESARQLSTLLIDVFQLSDPQREAGDTISAQELLRTGADRVDQELAGRPAVRAALLDEIARIEFNLGLLERAQVRAAAAGAAAATAFGATSAERSRILDLLGEIQYASNRFEAADSTLTESLAIREALGPVSRDSAMVDAMVQLWSVKVSRGDLETADSLATAADALALEVFGPDHPFVAEVRVDLAAGKHDAGDFSGAEQWFRDAVSVFERTPVDDASYSHAQALARLGQYTSFRGDYVEAEALQSRAVEVLSAILGREHVEVLSAQLSLANTRVNVGKRLQALDSYEYIDSVGTRVLGEGHARVRQSRQGMMNALSFLGRPEEARVALGRYWAIFTPPRPITRVPPGMSEVVIHRELGEFEEGRTMLDSMETIALRERGGTGFLPQIWINRGDLELAAGDTASARAAFVRAEELTAEHLRPDHRFFRATGMRLGELDAAEGDWRAVLENFEGYLSASEMRQATGHPSRVRLVLALAGAHCAAGNASEAEHWRRRLTTEAGAADWLQPTLRARTQDPNCGVLP